MRSPPGFGVVAAAIMVSLVFSPAAALEAASGTAAGDGAASPQAGDIFFCEWKHYDTDPGWDHVALYLGNGSIVEATPAGRGVVRVVEASYLERYTEAIRYGRVVSANASQREAAVDFAVSQLGKPYQYLNFLRPMINRSKDPAPEAEAWYCTELVWAAYWHQDIDLDLRGTFRGPVMPSEICWDDDVEMYEGHLLNSWHPGMYARWMIYQLLHLPIFLSYAFPGW
ncbi:MAG: YiiX/YebB-like N1pC/P60 family cysteine hydrolase [Thermoplasmatota archaeon]